MSNDSQSLERINMCDEGMCEESAKGCGLSFTQGQRCDILIYKNIKG